MTCSMTFIALAFALLAETRTARTTRSLLPLQTPHISAGTHVLPAMCHFEAAVIFVIPYLDASSQLERMCFFLGA